MVRFFSYLKDDRPKNVALQQAKLDYLQQADEITAHPFYWAGFIPIGDLTDTLAKIKRMDMDTNCGNSVAFDARILKVSAHKRKDDLIANCDPV